MNSSAPQAASSNAPGIFITLEGGEGSGKSTQIKRLVSRFAALGFETLATREPGGSPRAEQLREIILSGFVQPFGPVAESLAFAAARIDHLDKTIKPALEEGCVVICDRFIDSTRAYQGSLGDIDPKLILQLEQVTIGDTLPDLTLVLDLPPETGLKRASQRRGSQEADRFEGEELEFHRTVRQAFLRIIADEPKRCARIFAAKPEDEVEKDIWQIVEERLAVQLEARAPAASGGANVAAQTPDREAAAKRMPRSPQLRVVTESDLATKPEDGTSAGSS